MRVDEAATRPVAGGLPGHTAPRRPRAGRLRARLRGWRTALEQEFAVLCRPVVRVPADRRYVLGLAVLSLLAFALAARLRLVHGLPYGDEPAYLVLSQTMQKYHSINVMLDYDHRDYWSFYPAPLAPHVVPVPGGGTPQPLHGLGGPLLWLLPFVLWGRAGAVGFMVAVSVLVVVNSYLFLRERRISAGYALFTTLLLALGSPLYVYAAMSFVEPIGALIVLYATRVLLAHRPHPLRVLLAAAGLGFAPWVHTRLLTFSVSLGALLLLRLWLDRGRPRLAVLACCLLPLLAGAVAVEYYALSVWHSVNPAEGTAAFGNGPFQIPLHTGLAGTLYDRQYGLLPNFPLFLLVLPGILVALGRSYRLLQTVMLLVIGPYALLICTFWAWWGGYCPPGRFVAVVVPLLGYYVALILQRLHSWWLCVGAALLALIGYGFSLLTDVFPTERFGKEGGHNLAMDRVGALLDLPFARYVPSSFLPGQAPARWYWLAVTVAVGVALYLATGPWRRLAAEGPVTEPAHSPEQALAEV